MLTQKQQNRVTMLRSMDNIIRASNCESYLDTWLTLCVADRDNQYFSDEEFYEIYCDDTDDYYSMCETFMSLMHKICHNGGLYDGIKQIGGM